jgi:hypothetical protein
MIIFLVAMLDYHTPQLVHYFLNNDKILQKAAL